MTRILIPDEDGNLTTMLTLSSNEQFALETIERPNQQTKQIDNTAITLSDALIDADERVSRQLLCSAVDLVARNGLRPLLETARRSDLNLAYTALKAAGTNPDTTHTWQYSPSPDPHWPATGPGHARNQNKKAWKSQRHLTLSTT